jgi:hypothetical protein
MCRRELQYCCDRALVSGHNDHAIDVVLHIGQPKTGSSAIQRFSLLNRGPLLRAGYFYPKHDIMWTGVSGGHAALFDRITKESEFLERTTLDRLVSESRRLGGVLILSYEGLYDSAKIFRKLLSGLRVRVVGWFRHPADAFLSQIGQGVKRSFSTTSPLEDALNFSLRNARWKLDGQCLHEWADNFGDEACIFLPYLPPLHPEFQSIEIQWMSVLGIPKGTRDRFQASSQLVNRGYALDAIELKRAMNYVLKGAESKRCELVDAFLQNYSDKQKSFTPISAAVPKTTVENLIAMFTEPVEEMMDRFPALRPIGGVAQALLDSAGYVDGVVDFSEPLREFMSCYPHEFRWLQQHVAAEIEKGSIRDRVFFRLAGMLEEVNTQVQVPNGQK